MRNDGKTSGTPFQAEAKIVKIYEAVRDSVPWDVTCVRTKHTISIIIHSERTLLDDNLNAQGYRNVNDLDRINESRSPIDIGRLKKELPKLRAALDALMAQGTLTESAKMTANMYVFAAFLEKKLVAAQAARKVREPKEEPKDAVGKESGDVLKTVGFLRAVWGASGTGRRELVHLVDVQKSVQNTLANLNQNEEDEDEYSFRRRRSRRVKLYGENKEEDGLEPEEDYDAKQLKGIWLRRFVHSEKDSF